MRADQAQQLWYVFSNRNMFLWDNSKLKKNISIYTVFANWLRLLLWVAITLNSARWKRESKLNHIYSFPVRISKNSERMDIETLLALHWSELLEPHPEIFSLCNVVVQSFEPSKWTCMRQNLFCTSWICEQENTPCSNVVEVISCSQTSWTCFLVWTIHPNSSKSWKIFQPLDAFDL